MHSAYVGLLCGFHTCYNVIVADPKSILFDFRNRLCENQVTDTWNQSMCAHVHLTDTQTRHFGPQLIIIIIQMRPKIRMEMPFFFYFNAIKKTVIIIIIKQCKTLRVTSCSLLMQCCSFWRFFYWVHTERHTTLVYCSVSCVCFHLNGKWKINFSSKPDENTAIFSSFRFSFNSPNGFLFLHSITHKFTQFVHISAKHSECNEFN